MYKNEGVENYIKPKIRSYLTILTFLIAGMLIIGITSLIKTPSWLDSTFIVLILFITLNVITTKIFKLKTEIKRFWKFKRIYFLPIGVLVGGLIAVIPTLTSVLIGMTKFNELKLDTVFTFSSIIITIAIVSWEELWFRGIFLNYCNRNLSEVNISITIGFLFMLVHLLNPEINLIETGPTLFFAGALLTIVYFYYEAIWLPIGLHFGNNYLTLNNNFDKHWFFGNEGYFSTIILAILFIIFIKLTLNKTKQKLNLNK